jgi:PAS domain S-box-containing protein/putative nucleotidyltransferase with HDIG domain
MEEVIYRLEEALDKQRLERKLKESEEKYRTLYESSKDGIAFCNTEGNFLDANQGFLDMLGYSIEEIKRLTYQEITPKRWHKTEAEIFKNQIVKRGYSDEYEKENIKKDGTSLPITLRSWLIKDKQEKPIGTWAIIRDITERKKAMEEVEKLAKFPTENPNPVLRISKDGTVLYHNYASESLLEHWHYKEGKPLQDRWFQFVLDALKDDDIKTVETEIGDKVISLTFAPIVEKGFVNVYGLDITKRKKAEEQIKDSEKRLKILFDYAPDAYYISDLKGKFIDGNKVAERLMGYKREELIGSSFLKLKLLSLADIPKAAKLLVKNLRGQPTGPDEFILNRKDNSKVTVEISTYPVKIKERTLVLGIARDITERKQAEQELLQSHNKLLKTMEDTIYTIGKIAETRDPYTAGHQKSVSQIAVFIAQEMKLPKDKIEGIRIASLVHDIGKISIPAEILNKPTKLSEIEYSLIKDHSQVGYDVLKSIDFAYPIARIVLQHHERLDGSGYPQGLKGDEIILEARIIGVADVVEAMSSHRPYRPALGIDATLEEISKNKGILYDPEVVDACIKLFKEKRI